MQLLIDQCDGQAPLTPYADLKLPCGGRDVPDSALGALDISGGRDTAAAMAALRSQPRYSANGPARAAAAATAPGWASGCANARARSNGYDARW